MNKRVIGVSGLAGSGKDTFANILEKNLPNIKRFALADALKKEVRPALIDLYGIDINTCDRPTKDLIRPMLVAHGKVRRNMSNGRHWINLLRPKIDEFLSSNQNGIACITDIRYDFFEKDEVDWLKEELDGVLVHVSKYSLVNDVQQFTLPPNQDEAENDPKVIKKSSYRIVWPSVTKNDSVDLEKLNIYVEEFLKYFKR